MILLRYFGIESFFHFIFRQYSKLKNILTHLPSSRLYITSIPQVFHNNTSDSSRQQSARPAGCVNSTPVPSSPLPSPLSPFSPLPFWRAWRAENPVWFQTVQQKADQAADVRTRRAFFCAPSCSFSGKSFWWLDERRLASKGRRKFWGFFCCFFFVFAHFALLLLFLTILFQFHQLLNAFSHRLGQISLT